MSLDDSTCINLVVAGVTYRVWDETAEERFRIDASQEGKRVILCKWDDRVNICLGMLNGISGVPGSTIFVLGAPYPDNNSWVARDIKTRGDGKKKVGTNGMVGYERCRLTITYEPYWGGNAGIGQQRISYGSIGFSAGQGMFKWADNGTVILPELAPVLKVNTIEFNESMILFAIPRTLILNLNNCRNSAPIFGLPADKVLFNGGSSTQIFTVLGQQAIHMEYSFTYLSIGWNKLYKPGSGPTIYHFADGSDLYPAKDLNLLFNNNVPPIDTLG